MGKKIGKFWRNTLPQQLDDVGQLLRNRNCRHCRKWRSCFAVCMNGLKSKVCMSWCPERGIFFTSSVVHCRWFAKAGCQCTTSVCSKEAKPISGSFSRPRISCGLKTRRFVQLCVGLTRHLLHVYCSQSLLSEWTILNCLSKVNAFYFHSAICRWDFSTQWNGQMTFLMHQYLK